MSVNGGKISRTPISVDYFQRQHLPSRTLYFLTHLHTDHTYGLDSSFDQKIYCTSITKKLLLLELSLDPDLLVELEYDNPIQVHVDCPCDVVTIAVTAIDSFHCPGSAMYLFQGYFGTILHTGDFRFTPELSTHPLLQSLEPDILYLDNTYNNPIYDFPSRVSYHWLISTLLL
jgi:DNA cross-link repair 1B protein